MKRDEFSDDAPGELISTSFREHRIRDGARHDAEVTGVAFCPSPLPPNLPLGEMLPKIYPVLLEAERNLSLLEGIASRISNPHLLIGPFSRREAILSSRIENTFASARELALFEEDPQALEDDRDDVREVHNYVSALNHGLASERPISINLIRDMHRILLRSVRGEDKRPGEFRDRQNAIGGNTFESSRFVPPPTLRVLDCMRDLETFIHKKDDIPRLVRFAMVHYQFEAIHPFLDGNGRVGRLLITLLLCAQSQLTKPLVYVSGYFEANRQEYYDRLFEVSTRNRWIPWIEFFLRAVATQAEDARSRADRLIALQEEFQTMVREKRASAKLVEVVDGLFAKPSVTIQDVQDLTGMTPTAAGNLVKRLVEKAILVEATGKRRDRVFVAPKILNVIFE